MHNLSLYTQVALLFDEYDSVPNTISVTTLIKPIRQIILGREIDKLLEENPDTIVDTPYNSAPSFIGSAVHSYFEKGLRNPLKALQYIETSELDRKHLKEAIIEQRYTKEIVGCLVTGKPDLIGSGHLYDIKTTGTYTYIKGNRDQQYIDQCSIYRLLSPDVTSDIFTIIYIFSAWQASQMNTPNYPPQAILEKHFALKSKEDTLAMVVAKLSEIERYTGLEQDKIPECTPEELWMDSPTFKYYSNPDKTDGRSTKNFDTLHDASKYRIEKGKGIVIEAPVKAKACNFCKAVAICEQANSLMERGML
jgi:hypothetical protein